VHIYVLGPKLLRWNFLQISHLSIQSGAQKLFCWFLDLSQFLTALSRILWHHLAMKKAASSASERAIHSEKKHWKQNQNRPINYITILAQIISPSNKRHTGLGAWQTEKHTNTTLSHLQPARIVRYLPNFARW